MQKLFGASRATDAQPDRRLARRDLEREAKERAAAPLVFDKPKEEAKANTTQPTLICCKTIIGYGSPNKSGSHDCHGAPLGKDEITKVREFLKWPYAPFDIPADIYQAWNAKEQGAHQQASWQQHFSAYRAEYQREAVIVPWAER